MNPSSAIANYQASTETDLCTICEKYGTDKGPRYHDYSRFYHELFNPIRNESVNIFEMGVGPSLHAWREYFPQGSIYGADIEPSHLINEERIQSFQCDGTNPDNIQALWNNDSLKDVQFDVIIEDGIQTIEGIEILFKSSIQKLKVGGVFIVEDIGAGMRDCDARKKLEEFETEYSNIKCYDLVFITPRNWPQINDNNLLVIQKIE